VIGVLAMAYGTAAGPDDVERYYTDIRGGRQPSPEHLAELLERYAAIGNRFPLLDITTRQAEALEEELNARAGPDAYRVYLGMKHSAPSVADGVARIREDGLDRAVGLVLAPHWSAMSVETYVERVEKALAEAGGGPRFSFVRQWCDHPGFLDFLASRVRDAITELTPQERGVASVVFSAHSLPTRELPDGTFRCKACDLCTEECRYVAGLRQTAEGVARRLGLPFYTIGWQSAGRTADPWWGPSVDGLIRDVAAAGHPAVVVCSAGFVSDHLETLYDLDVEARAVAKDVGVSFVRTEMPNADPDFIRVLADVVLRHVRESSR
jgi:protoporphyrin/coproporphyrin ferrochelatase